MFQMSVIHASHPPSGVNQGSQNENFQTAYSLGAAQPQLKRKTKEKKRISKHKAQYLLMLKMIESIVNSKNWEKYTNFWSFQSAPTGVAKIKTYLNTVDQRAQSPEEILYTLGEIASAQISTKSLLGETARHWVTAWFYRILTEIKEALFWKQTFQTRKLPGGCLSNTVLLAHLRTIERDHHFLTSPRLP